MGYETKDNDTNDTPEIDDSDSFLPELIDEEENNDEKKINNRDDRRKDGLIKSLVFSVVLLSILSIYLVLYYQKKSFALDPVIILVILYMSAEVQWFICDHYWLMIILTNLCVIIASVLNNTIIMDCVMNLLIGVSLGYFLVRALKFIIYIKLFQRNRMYIFLSIYNFVVSGFYIFMLLFMGRMIWIRQAYLKNGASISFGYYEQDGDTNNGNEILRWVVVDVADGKALLISDQCIDYLQFSNLNADNLWKNSSIRYWLNTDFYNDAFSDKEKDFILEKELVTYPLIKDKEGLIHEQNESESISLDRVFLPSLREASEYFIVRNNGVSNAAMKKSGEGEDLPREKYYWIRNPFDEKSASRCFFKDNGMGHVSFKSPEEYKYICPMIYIDIYKYYKYSKSE